MRITYSEGVGIPIGNLSDAEIANLLALLDAAIDKRLASQNSEHRKRAYARRPEYDWVA